MKHNNSYIYPKTVRTDIDGKRHYDIDGGKWKLPSVTTILSATQSAENRESLPNWRKRYGDAQDIGKIYIRTVLSRSNRSRPTSSQYGSTSYPKRIM